MCIISPLRGYGPLRILEEELATTIHVLVGTMSGSAEIVAEDLCAAITADSDHQAEMLLMDDLDESVFERDGVFLICTSTYGQGEVPDNAVDFFKAVEAAKPDLSHIRYGVFGLGDMAYADTFNFGGKRFDDLLSSLGAKRIGVRAQHDASGPDAPEEAALLWLKDWLPQVDAALRDAA